MLIPTIPGTHSLARSPLGLFKLREAIRQDMSTTSLSSRPVVSQFPSMGLLDATPGQFEDSLVDNHAYRSGQVCLLKKSERQWKDTAVEVLFLIPRKTWRKTFCSPSIANGPLPIQSLPEGSKHSSYQVVLPTG